MLVVAGDVVIDPERVSEGTAAAREVMAATRREPGCISYTFSADLEEPGRFHVFEEWESEATLVEHLRAPSYLNMLAHLGKVGIRAAVTRKYRVDRDEPVYDEHGRPRGDFVGD